MLGFVPKHVQDVKFIHIFQGIISRFIVKSKHFIGAEIFYYVILPGDIFRLLKRQFIKLPIVNFAAQDSRARQRYANKMLRIIDSIIQLVQVEAKLQFGRIPQQPSFPANGYQAGLLLLDLGDTFGDILQNRQFRYRLDGFNKKRAQTPNASCGLGHERGGRILHRD